MSMVKIARFLKINGSVEGVASTDRGLALPGEGFVARYRPWAGVSFTQEQVDDLRSSRRASWGREGHAGVFLS